MKTNPTPTTIVEITRPQPTMFFSWALDPPQPAYRDGHKQVSIQPPHQPGDIIDRDGKRWEVVSVKCEERLIVLDEPPTLRGFRTEKKCVWVYEVKGDDDE